ncbi:hypothetical protein [Niallia sp. BSM11]|uniref:hypothetical protein n=1 Tax=Niallia sp. BSM11 TaxID=3391576 RepID=UPI00398508D8
MFNTIARTDLRKDSFNTIAPIPSKTPQKANIGLKRNKTFIYVTGVKASISKAILKAIQENERLFAGIRTPHL